jgi:hypothetical protein
VIQDSILAGYRSWPGSKVAGDAGQTARESRPVRLDGDDDAFEGARRLWARKRPERMKGPDRMARRQGLQGVQAECAADVDESNRRGECGPSSRQFSSEIGDGAIGHDDKHDRLTLRLQHANEPLDPASGREQSRGLTGGPEGSGEAPSNLASARDDQRRGQRPVGRSV